MPSMTAALTGSTGNLGSYLLDALLQRPEIERVICLNRSPDALSRQVTAAKTRGLTAQIPSTRVTFLTCDLSQPQLGLKRHDFEWLGSVVTLIIHNAWPVNFNKHFSSFEPSIRGVSNLIDFARKSTRSARIFFVSSISAAGSWGALPGARLKVPEVELDDWKVARLGYGQSKLVSERLLAAASRSCGVVSAVCRVGQVAGPTFHGDKGVWPKQEWLPSLIASSKAMRMLPKTLGSLDEVDWVPVDSLASVMVELLMLLPDQSAATTEFYHAVNPVTRPWSKLLPTVQRHLNETIGPEKGILRIVEFPEWVEALKRSADGSAGSLEQNPAVKLLPFFENLLDKAVRLPHARATILDTEKTARKSQTLSALGPVREEWMSVWLKQWDV